MANIIFGCKKCKALTTNFFINDNGKKSYWFATLKDSDDFSIMKTDDNGNLRLSFLTFTEPRFPIEFCNKYDWYCNECYLFLMKQKEINQANNIIDDYYEEGENDEDENDEDDKEEW